MGTSDLWPNGTEVVATWGPTPCHELLKWACVCVCVGGHLVGSDAVSSLIVSELS